MIDLTSQAVQLAAAEFARKLRHKSDCRRRDETKLLLGNRGDPIVMCRNCGKYRVVEGVRTPEPDVAPAAVAVAPPKPGRLRCRIHHDEEVTWRGAGCRACAKERAR